MVRPVDYVDPFIGVDGEGHCLPGPYLPLGLVRLGPDTLPPQHTSGYETGRPIICFSHTHVSGTGGMGRYGNVGVTPQLGPAGISNVRYEPAEEQASAGYYSVLLNPAGIRAELTVTQHVGVHRYTFPVGYSAHLFIDLSTVIRPYYYGPQNDPNGWPPESIGGYIEFISDTEIVGRGDYRGGWGHNFTYSVYFYARSGRPMTDQTLARAGSIVYDRQAVGAFCQALASFGEVQPGDSDEVTLQVGISFVSVAKARASVEREVGDKDFDTVRAEAAATWEKALGRIRVEGGSEEQKMMFYSMLHRLLCMPTDLGVDDEFSQWHSGVRHFSDFYCLWDSVRNANSFIGLFEPQLEVDMLNCLLDIAKHRGWLPDAWIAGHSGTIQGGSSADILLCEAALKNFTGIDYEQALQQVRKNNEVESPDPYLYGRYLQDYRDLGYVSARVPRYSVSRHLEYAYQDWCIGALAQKLGHDDIAQAYFKSSKKVWNLWRDDLKCFAPRQPNGRWVDPFDPERNSAESWNDRSFYEGTSRQWSFNVQHDFAGLISRYGGPEAFIVYLDRMFDEGHIHSKETMLHVPYLYHYAGRPDKTAERVREFLGSHFHTGRDGLPDNEDMGCQSTFYLASTIGFYPLMGQDIYWLTTPIFARIEVALGDSGKTLIIEAPGAGDENIYIASATLNGEPLDRAWLRHSEIANGAVLRYELSPTPTSWGSKVPPPSPLTDL